MGMGFAVAREMSQAFTRSVGTSSVANRRLFQQRALFYYLPIDGQQNRGLLIDPSSSKK